MRNASKGFAVVACLVGSLLSSGAALAQLKTEKGAETKPAIAPLDALIGRATKGDAEAQALLARRYAMGNGVSRDLSLAAGWYAISAEQQNAESMFGLGRLYFLGQGVPQDYSVALKWFERVARTGNADVQYVVARMYAEGLGTSIDEAAARKWLTLSAMQGHAAASADLGDLYAFGAGGVPTDPDLAIGLYGLALKNAKGDLKADVLKRMGALSTLHVSVVAPVSEAAELTAEPVMEAVDPEVPVAGEELIGIMQTTRDADFPAIAPSGPSATLTGGVALPAKGPPPKGIVFRVRTVDATFMAEYCAAVPANVTGRWLSFRLNGKLLSHLNDYTTDTAVIAAFSLPSGCGTVPDATKPLVVRLSNASGAAPFQIYLNNDGSPAKAYSGEMESACTPAGSGPYRLFRLICEAPNSPGQVRIQRSGAALLIVDVP